MSQTGKLMPNLDQQSTKMLNLTVLQRIDPFIEEILITAAHVTFYEFNIESNQWSRKDVEGSLFVVKRNTQPRFQFIVMNRRNTGLDLRTVLNKTVYAYSVVENLVENLLGDFEYEIQVPYLLYRNASQEVNGIWFYNPRECEDVANLFNRILNAYSKVPPKPKVSSNKSEFEELEAVPTLSVMEGPLEPTSTTTTAADAPEDPSFENYFSTATSIGSNAPNAPSSRQPYHSSATIPLLSHAPIVISSAAPAPQAPSLTLSSSSTPIAIHDTPDPISSGNRVTNLVKPSFFSPPSSSSTLMMPPISSSVPTAPALNPPLSLQRPYGAPMLQPFPPPTPPPSLTPSSAPPIDRPLITREKVRDALLMLVQRRLESSEGWPHLFGMMEHL
ncbi:mRNA-decapping enzyme-like protein [Citrus sinensis]|uniref:mRNA-decapping enzyme-like protein n=1 Tax=Citrus sinensis TaxID=2711 RepID=A0ACB8JYY7_CITSI|nr:mRNA-decapping enzyme-like protein [Citrus sinensis]